MQKGKKISKLLGIKQEELAMLLNISKGQLAMFETGKRGLPTSALLLLAPMLQFVQEESLKSGSAEELKVQAEKQKKMLEHLLKENKYKQKVLERKLEIAENKYQANRVAIKLMQFLENEAMKKDVPADSPLLIFKRRAKSDLEKNGWGVVAKFQIQKELLQAEEKMLLKMGF